MLVFLRAKQARNTSLTLFFFTFLSLMTQCNRQNHSGKSETTTDVSHLSAGVYFLCVGERTAKFVKE